MTGIDELLSSEFNRFVLRHEPGYFAPLVRQIEALTPVRGRRVMDFGCGVGDLGFALLEAGAVHLDGIDISRPAIEQAMRRATDMNAATFTCADLMTSPWGGSAVDVLVSHSVVHYIPRPLPAILSLLAELVVPGGHLFLTFEAHSGPSLLNAIQRFNLRFAPEWLRRRFYLAVLVLLGIRGGAPRTPEELEIVKAKSRYLSIPVVHAAGVETLTAAAATAGLVDVRVGPVPLLHPLQIPHLYMAARRQSA
ncbi:MAG: class I SAM-dependent methyltransferase [Alphaproteobacteria bacterium]